MKVLNIHERELPVPADQVGVLIDSLSSRDDALWPKQSWPRMELDRPLSVGASGGHGPIRYIVEAYTPGQMIRFHLTGPAGFNGYHRYEIIKSSARSSVLRHTLEMITHGPAVVSWPVAFRPMHDALVEDSLAVAEASLGQPPQVRPWSGWVRLLRWMFSKGRARPQIAPRVRTDASDQPVR